MNSNSTTAKPLPLLTYDVDEPVLTGLRIGNAVLHAVYGPLLNERDVPEPLPCSRTLHFTSKKEGR